MLGKHLGFNKIWSWSDNFGLDFCGVVCDCQQYFSAQFSNFIWAVEKYGNVISYFFEKGGFCNSCVGKVAECFWGHIVTLCRPRHLIQCKFAHFILPACGHFCPLYPPPLLPFCGHQSQALRLRKQTSLPKSCQKKFSNLCIDHYWPCAMIIRPERQSYILQ